MKKFIILFILTLPYFSFGQEESSLPNKLLGFQPFIGDWYTLPDEELLNQFPETKDMVGFRFEWENSQKKILKYYEGIPGGKLENYILGATVIENPRTGDLEFIGYQKRNDYLFKGKFYINENGKELIRFYEVHYPHGTKFRSAEDSLKGMIVYRDICQLKGRDTLTCVVEKLKGGIWHPWGNGKPFSMIRKPLPARPIPQHIKDNWARQTKGRGIWIANNSQFKNKNEPYDAYGMEWTWGIGKSSIKGRLYCIQKGKDVGTIWEFLNYWDPESQVEKMIQIGSNGTIGRGEIMYQDDGSTRSEESFVNPEGGTFSAGHHSWFKGENFHTQSFDLDLEQWKKRRLYVWKPVSSSD